GREREVNLLKEADVMIFDWDGVLFDSNKRIYRAIYRLIKLLGDPEKIRDLTEERVAETYDAPPAEYIARFGITDFDAARAVYAKITEEVKRELPEEDVYPEVIAMLRDVRAQKPKMKFAIISAGHADEIELILARHGIRHYFETIVGGQYDKKSAVREVTEKCKSAPERTLYFGDLPADINDTKGSGTGVKSVAVARTPHAEKRLVAYAPNFLVTGVSIFKLKKAKKYGTR
ncbi:MAG: hypothetical protein RLZZ283_712, partial [Candidatus Parcubacteria bacterium]